MNSTNFTIYLEKIDKFFFNIRVFFKPWWRVRAFIFLNW
jgi:hypothetical protein